MEAVLVPVFERHNTCLSCGYDLFGQPRNSVCPECGTSTRESALQDQFLADPAKMQRLRSGSMYLLISSILCGGCPGMCLIWMVSDRSIVCAILMTLIFAATCITAAIGDGRLRELVEASRESAEADFSIRVIADFVAAIGLLLINFAAYLGSQEVSPSSSYEPGAVMFAGIGFGLLFIVAWRAWPAGRMQSYVAEACWRRKGGLLGLGAIKAIYESIWLGSIAIAFVCAMFDGNDPAIFFAFVAFFGLFGFAGIWLAMIIVHALFFARVRHYITGPRGFEVVAAK